MAVIFDSI
jgi:serine/threonine protein kinase